MIKKLLGIDEKSITKKSNYYGYLVTSIMGSICIVIGITFFILQYSNTFENILEKNYENIIYLEKMSKTINDETLLLIANSYKVNIALIDELPRQTGLFFILFGLVLLINFKFFNELKNNIENKKS